MAKRNQKSREIAASLPSEPDRLPSEADETLSWDRIRHFKPREFTCNCEGLCDHPDAISREMVQKLDKIRDLIGKPVEILSGTGCERQNRKVGGKVRSAHIPKNGVSHAADIRCPELGVSVRLSRGSIADLPTDRDREGLHSCG